MTDTVTAFRAGIDAVIADNTLNQNGFENAILAVLTGRFSRAEADAWVTAIYTEYNRLGLINNPTYGNMRGSIISAGAVPAQELFSALAASINALPETAPAIQSAALIDLRIERDNVNAALDRADALIAAERGGVVGRLIRDVLREGKNSLRQYKEQVRTQIQNITGDPDS